MVFGYERVSKPLPIPAHASSSFLCWLQVRWCYDYANLADLSKVNVSHANVKDES